MENSESLKQRQNFSQLFLNFFCLARAAHFDNDEQRFVSGNFF
jgi:hypothetical protein